MRARCAAVKRAGSSGQKDFQGCAFVVVERARMKVRLGTRAEMRAMKRDVGGIVVPAFKVSS